MTLSVTMTLAVTMKMTMKDKGCDNETDTGKANHNHNDDIYDDSIRVLRRTWFLCCGCRRLPSSIPWWYRRP